jgi:hypothetical protein
MTFYLFHKIYYLSSQVQLFKNYVKTSQSLVPILKQLSLHHTITINQFTTH